MHYVNALVGTAQIIEDIASRFPSGVMCPLVQGFSLLPITDSLTKDLAFLTLTQSDSVAPDMPLGVATIAAKLSSAGLIAYISTQFWGGTGGQDALVWQAGDIVLKLSDDTDKTMKWPNSPVSQALRKIGVIADEGKDEFDTIGLRRHRSTHRWAAAFGQSNDRP